MLLETMVDVGWWLMIIGAKSFSIFCTFKKSAQNQDHHALLKKVPKIRTKIETKKRDQEVPFF